jgi:hypothetical protein
VLGGGCGEVLRRERAGFEGEELAGALTASGGRGAQEAVGTDLGEALGQDVLEEASEEGMVGQGQAAGLAAARVDVAEGDPLAVEALDALVGESDAVDVAREVLGGVVAVAGVLEVDGPGLAEEGGVEAVEQLGAGQGVAHAGAEDLREGVAGDEEAGMSRLSPGVAVGGVRPPAVTSRWTWGW